MREQMIRKIALQIAACTVLSLLVGCATNKVEPTAANTTAPGATAAPAASSAPAANPAATNSRRAAAVAPATTPAARVATRQYVIPSGTVITVRLNDSLASNVSQTGQSFTATVVDPIQVNQRTMIAQGATATGTVVEAQPLGKFEGGARLELRLVSID